MQAFFSYYIVAGKKKGKGVISNSLDVTRYNPSDSAYDGEEMVMIRLSDYNRFAKAADMETLKLKQGEVLYLPPLFSHGETSKWISGNEESFYFKESSLSVKVMAKEEQSPFIHDMESAALVVSDADVQKLDPSGSKGRFTAYLVPDWRDTTSFGVKFVEDLTKGINGWEESPASQFFDSHGYTSRLITSRAFDYATVQLGPRTGLFVGIFIAAIFVISAGSFLYFRLHTDLNQDRKQYRTLAKSGHGASGTAVLRSLCSCGDKCGCFLKHGPGNFSVDVGTHTHYHRGFLPRSIPLSTPSEEGHVLT